MATLPDDLEVPRVRPLRRAEYDRLVADGWFEHERIELLDGLLFEMSPPHPPHSHSIRRLDALLRRVEGRAEVSAQLPLAVSGDSEPQPDLALIPPGDYTREHPDFAWLVVEVSDSSLRHDRARKGRIYARAGIPEYWIVNLRDAVIEVYTAPGSEGYGEKRVAGPDETVAPAAFPDVVIRVGDVLPR